MLVGYTIHYLGCNKIIGAYCVGRVYNRLLCFIYSFIYLYTFIGS